MSDDEKPNIRVLDGNLLRKMTASAYTVLAGISKPQPFSEGDRIIATLDLLAHIIRYIDGDEWHLETRTMDLLNWDSAQAVIDRARRE